MRVKSSNLEVFKNQVLHLKGKYIAFIVTGTWLVSIAGIIRVPGDYWQENVTGDDCLENDYEIQFLEDLSPDYIGDKTLKSGKFLLIRCTNYVSNG
jgi:hypothetical protein